ncbi:uncharacterized protein LOC130820695 [Amaranthus tricolor]|uniref:uncharacterized protein LOC130820695 n=1 Tax=Amaranthus tricolor TaxID=29722 RepID=UPI002584827B|nr:uncharacterized protein LOC130820695 [Amaranthus tricolor]
MDNECNYRKKVKEESFYGGSRSRSRNSRSSSSGRWQQPVLSLEKKFCATVGGVSWQQVLDTQKYMYKDDKVLQWKDSAVQEAFWNAKKRFLAKMRGQPCDIKLPDPDIFIDEIDWDSIVDPELLLDLDKRDVEVPCETEKDSGVVFGIPVVPEQYALTPMGWGDAESVRDDKQLNVSERVDTSIYEQVHWGENNGVNGWDDDYVYVTHDMVNQPEENNTRNGGSTWNSDYKKKRWGDYGGYNKKLNNSNGGRNTSRYRISRYYHCNGNNARYGCNNRGNFSNDERPMIQWKPVSKQTVDGL